MSRSLRAQHNERARYMMPHCCIHIDTTHLTRNHLVSYRVACRFSSTSFFHESDTIRRQLNRVKISGTSVIIYHRLYRVPLNDRQTHGDNIRKLSPLILFSQMISPRITSKRGFDLPDRDGEIERKVITRFSAQQILSLEASSSRDD